MALRRHRRTALGLALLAAYGGCAIPWRQLGHEYGGTIVDAHTGEPIEGAVMVVSWITCSYIGMDSCRGYHSPLEAVSGPDGGISLDGTPWPVWNPNRYLWYPQFEIRAVGYLPGWGYTDPSFDRLSEIAAALRDKPRIALSKPAHFDGWRDPKKTPREEYRWVVGDLIAVRTRDLPKVPQFRRVFNLQLAEVGLPPRSGEPRR